MHNRVRRVRAEKDLLSSLKMAFSEKEPLRFLKRSYIEFRKKLDVNETHCSIPIHGIVVVYRYKVLANQTVWITDIVFRPDGPGGPGGPGGGLAVSLDKGERTLLVRCSVSEEGSCSGKDEEDFPIAAQLINEDVIGSDPPSANKSEKETLHANLSTSVSAGDYSLPHEVALSGWGIIQLLVDDALNRGSGHLASVLEVADLDVGLSPSDMLETMNLGLDQSIPACGADYPPLLHRIRLSGWGVIQVLIDDVVNRGGEHLASVLEAAALNLDQSISVSDEEYSLLHADASNVWSAIRVLVDEGVGHTSPAGANDSTAARLSVHTDTALLYLIASYGWNDIQQIVDYALDDSGGDVMSSTDVAYLSDAIRITQSIEKDGWQVDSHSMIKFLANNLCFSLSEDYDSDHYSQ